MSVICCVHRPDGKPVNAEALNRMIQVARPFGPDTEGRWLGRQVNLGYCGLWTLKESMGEHQPVSNNTGTVWVVCDARIDNAKQLREELARFQATQNLDTSAGLMLAAYEAWGTACAAKIIGDFAFVIWDSEHQRLFCARDALGVRPLFYSFDGQTFSCSTFIRQLLQVNGISTDLDEEFMADFLVRGDCPSELTPYRGIKRLLGGWSIIIEDLVVKKEQYWDLDPKTTIRYSSDEEYGQHFKSVFREAVSARLRSCGPLAAELSGGLDSSSIVCMAQEIYRSGDAPNEGFYALTHLFEEASEANEREFSRAVIDKFDIRVEYFSAEAHWPLQDHHQDSLYWDEPTLKGPVTPLLREVAGCLLRNKTRVLLSGIGGDQVLLGDTRIPLHLVESFQGFHWRRLGRELHAWQQYLKRPMLQMFLENCIIPLRYPNSMLLPETRGLARVPDWIDPAFSRKYDLPRRTPLYGFLPRLYRSPAAQKQYLTIKRTSAPLLQWYMADPQIEARYPYLDRRLVEFAMAIPMDQKLRIGETRSVLRRAMQGILPEKVRTRRRKAVFDQANSISLKKEWKMVSHLAKSSSLASLGIIDSRRFHRALESASLGLLKEGYLFWATLSLEMWVRALLRGQSAKPIATIEHLVNNHATYPPSQARV
jgi:asparagine synthase (glutamine-hydrolysing)